MTGINRHRGTQGELWQPRFFDRAIGTVKEYHEKVEEEPLKSSSADGRLSATPA